MTLLERFVESEETWLACRDPYDLIRAAADVKVDVRTIVLAGAECAEMVARHDRCAADWRDAVQLARRWALGDHVFVSELERVRVSRFQQNMFLPGQYHIYLACYWAIMAALFGQEHLTSGGRTSEQRLASAVASAAKAAEQTAKATSFLRGALPEELCRHLTLGTLRWDVIEEAKETRLTP